MSGTRSVWATIALVLPAIVVLLSLYQTLFWLWMTAYAPANAVLAKTHMGVWLGITVLGAIGFIVALRRQRGRKG